MADRAIVNASPLIFLSKAHLTHLLQLAAPQVLVPEAVAAEIGRRGPDDITARTLASASWLMTVVVS